jgi:hypothetical protein
MSFDRQFFYMEGNNLTKCVTHGSPNQTENIQDL